MAGNWLLGHLNSRNKKTSQGCNKQWFKVKTGLSGSLHEVCTPDQVVQACHTQLSQPLANLLSEQREIIDEVLGLTRELGTQVLSLGSNPSGTGVEMALTCHIAA